MDKELNIKSSTIEKGLDLAKEFLGKLISPTIEEVGLLISDNIKFIRFKNQVNILLKAQKYVEERNIAIGKIPTKVLVPLLDNASLEEDEDMQEKWAKMIANMADSETTLHNQIFPYILSQLSISEYQGLVSIYNQHEEYKAKQSAAYLLPNIKNQYSNDFQKLQEINRTLSLGFWGNLDGHEFANLIRLGLIRQMPAEIYIPEFRTGGSEENAYQEQWHSIDIKYGDEGGYVLTDLGILFLDVVS